MKKALLFGYLLICTALCVAQDPNPDFFQTWYLYTIEFESGPIVNVADFDPPISPTFIPEASLNFIGDGACNSFNGSLNFSPPNDFSVVSMDKTTTSCGMTLDQFEINYFSFFEVGNFFFIDISDIGGGEQVLRMTGGPFTDLTFHNVPILSNSNFEQRHVITYPNPVTDQIFITSENNSLQELTIYNAQGKRVFDISTVSSPLDVSSLSAGLYFLEVVSEKARTIQKFIKQ